MSPILCTRCGYANCPGARGGHCSSELRPGETTGTADTQLMRAVRDTDRSEPPDPEALTERESLPDGFGRISHVEIAPAPSVDPPAGMSRITLEVLFSELQAMRSGLDHLDMIGRQVNGLELAMRLLQQQQAQANSAITTVMHLVGGPLPKTLAGRALLLVEDNPELGTVQYRAWKDAGADVALQRTRASAMAWLDRCDRLDAAIVDVRLPDGSGLEVAERIQHTWPDAALIITTGYSTEQYAADAMRLGATLLAKPYLPVDAVTRALQEQLA